MSLEARYRGLLRLYPRDWQEHRADEMVATYLDTAPPGRTRPSTADRLDVARGALRYRVDLAAKSGLRKGIRLAAELALVVVTVLGTIWLLTPVAVSPSIAALDPGFFGYLNEATCAAWIAVGAGGAFLRAKWRRMLTAGALTLTALLIPGTIYTVFFPGYAYDLAPVVALGALTLYLSDDRRLPARLAPVAAAAATAAVQLTLRPDDLARYAGGALLLAVLAFAVGHGLRRRADGLWALLILAAPIAMLLRLPLFPIVPHHFMVFDVHNILSTLLAFGLITVVLLGTAVALQNRRAAGRERSRT